MTRIRRTAWLATVAALTVAAGHAYTGVMALTTTPAPSDRGATAAELGADLVIAITVTLVTLAAAPRIQQRVWAWATTLIAAAVLGITSCHSIVESALQATIGSASIGDILVRQVPDVLILGAAIAGVVWLGHPSLAPVPRPRRAVNVPIAEPPKASPPAIISGISSSPVTSPGDSIRADRGDFTTEEVDNA